MRLQSYGFIFDFPKVLRKNKEKSCFYLSFRGFYVPLHSISLHLRHKRDVYV